MDNASISLPPQLTVVAMLAPLLERIERTPAATHADQYRSIVQHLTHELQAVQGNASLALLLDAYPAAAEVYENLNYAHAGLCRSPHELAFRAELRARDEIRRIQRKQA